MPAVSEPRTQDRRTRADPRQVIWLDLLRFAAAAMVMVYHLGFASWANPASPARLTGGDFSVYAGLAPFASFGWVGVQVFFVLSGFVIANTAERASAAAFFRNRVLRLAPGVWVCATLTLLIALAVRSPESNLAEQYLRSVFFVPQGPWISGVYWTLGVEISFYGLILLLLGIDRFRNVEGVISAVGSVSVLFWAIYLAAEWIPLGQAGALVRTLGAHRAGELLLLQHGCFFALGAMLWLALTKQMTGGRMALAAAFTAGCLAEIVVKTGMTGNYMSQDLSPVTPILVWTVSVCVLICGVAANRRAHAAMGRYASTLRTLGLATFPLYLLHELVGVVLLKSLLEVHLPPGLALPLAMMVIVALSLLVLPVEARVRQVLRARLTTPEVWAGRIAPGLLRQTDPVGAAASTFPRPGPSAEASAAEMSKLPIRRT